MNTHERPELLSAYVDGELFGDELAAAEGHVAGCAECRGTVEAIRATLTDLRLLDEPEPSAFESRLLRDRLAAARRRPARVLRAAAAVSGIAAVVAGFVVFAGGSMSSNDTFGTGVAGYPPPGPQAMVTEEFTKRSVDQLAIRGLADDDARAATTADAMAESAPLAAGYSAGSAGCEQQTQTNNRAVYAPQAVFEGTYRGRPAYIFVYLTPASDPTHREVWVLSQSDCGIIYWRQHPLG